MNGMENAARGSVMVKDISKAEQVAIERHRANLCKVRGREVSEDEALADWLEHYALQWRRARHVKMLAMQREEILRYKWIESEKRHRDLGAEAVFEWIRRYAADWRTWFDEHEID
jgi:hypothetical protein